MKLNHYGLQVNSGLVCSLSTQDYHNQLVSNLYTFWDNV